MPVLLWVGALLVLLTSCATERETGPRAPLQFATAVARPAPDAYAQSQTISIESQGRGSVFRRRVKNTGPVQQVDFDETAPGDLKEYDYRLDDLKSRGLTVRQLYQRAEFRLKDLLGRQKLRFRLNPNRTQFLTYALAQEFGVRLGTVQLYFAASAHVSVRDQNPWWYHLGTLVLEDGKEWVIDRTPGFVARPVPLAEWLRIWGKNAECAEITHEHEGFFEAMRSGSRFPGTGYGGFADCYFRRAPMYYWTPRSLLSWDIRSAPTRTDFNLTEIAQSCADGTRAARADVPVNHRRDSCRIYLAKITPASRPAAPVESPAPSAKPAPAAPASPSDEEGDFEL